MPRRFALAAALLALGLSACGSSSSTGTGAAATTAASVATTAASVAPTTTVATPAADDVLSRPPGTAATLDEARAELEAQIGLTGEQAGCVVDGLAGALGETKALALVNDPRDIGALAEADAAAIVTAMQSCVKPEDVRDLIANSFHAELQDSGVTEVQAGCVADKLTAVFSSASLYELATGIGSFDQIDPADQGKLFQAVIDCVPPEVLSQLAADNGAEAGAAAPTTTAG